MIVCLDTNVLVWGIQGHARSSQQGMIPRTRALLADLQERKAQVIVPAPAVAEFLVGIPAERQPEVMEVISHRFAVVPFDAAAATVYGQLWDKRFGDAPMRDVMDEMDSNRRGVVVDMQIAAIALTRRAHILYTNDPKLPKYLFGEPVAVSDVPQVEVQAALFQRGQDAG